MKAATFNLVLLIVIVLTIALVVGLNVKGFIDEKKKRDKLKFPPIQSAKDQNACALIDAEIFK